MKQTIKRFREWQQRPYTVAPISDKEHTCPTCDTRFRGNFCPRCGQSASMSRFSFKSAMLDFVSIWGLGNRSMLRTLRDLVLRPGYMIRDYLKGKRAAYFPPFRLLALASLLSITLDVYVLPPENDTPQQKTEQKIAAKDKDTEAATTRERWINSIDDGLNKLHDDHRTIFYLMLVTLTSVFLYFPFRHSRTFSSLYFSEFTIAVVYMAVILIATSVVYDLFMKWTGITLNWTRMICDSLIVSIILSQMTGFSWLRSLAYVFIAYIELMVSIFCVMFIVSICATIYSSEYSISVLSLLAKLLFAFLFIGILHFIFEKTKHKHEHKTK